MATIHCEDCGTRRERTPKNTRYCPSCRLLRNVEYFVSEGRPCANCKTTFAPIERGDIYCGSCNPGSASAVGRCKLCKTDDTRLVRCGVAVCKVCAREPKLRLTLIAGLRKGQAIRKSQNGGTP